MNLPSDFIMRTKPLLKNEWDVFLSALTDEIPVSIRLNKTKCKGVNHSLSYKVPWCETGYYLAERPQFTFDPLLHAGCYYVQEASSMFVEQAIKQYAAQGIRVLDLCAAPGGKSTLVADLLDEDSLLVPNEVIRSRAQILAENITKCGYPNVVVTNNDPSDIGRLTNYFDVILVDAPCSGEGMFRKDERAITEWSVDNVKLCKERQQRILADIWAALKPGGLLLYSTCTYNIEENEENVLWISQELGAEILPIDIKDEWGISPSYINDMPVYHFFPHKARGEGFFFGLLRKTEGDDNIVIRYGNKKNKDKKNKKAELESVYKEYITNTDQFTFYQKKESWFAFPSHLYDDLQMLESQLNIISEGICLGESKGRSFIPDQSLAMSNYLNTDAFVLHDVDWPTAIAFLRKESLVLPDLPVGYILLSYKGKALGFMKNIGNRANNLYPQEWRIRSANLPAGEVGIL